MAQAPWSDCKVAFGVDNPERLWRAVESGKAELPPGWELDETDCSGARCVAVFRVDGVPTVEDGRSVARAIRRWGR